MLLELPDSVLHAFGNDEKKLRLELAVVLFEKDVFTLAQGARFASMHRMDFQKELGERNINMHYDIEDLKYDLESLERLRNK